MNIKSVDYWKKQKEHLTKLYETYGNFHVCKRLGFPWRLFSTINPWIEGDYIMHREVFPFELAIDIDLTDNKKIKYYSERIMKRLEKYKMNYNAYSSGNKGADEMLCNHIQCFIPELGKLNYDERCIMKEALINFFLQEDKEFANVDYQLCNKHMLRAEFAPHEKSDKHKTLAKKFRHCLTTENIIPKGVWSEYQKLKDNQKPRNLPTRSGTLAKYPCITYLMGEDFVALKEGRKRAATVLMNYFYTNDKDKAKDIVAQWSDYKLNGYINRADIRNIYNGIKKMHEKGHQFGCRFIRQLLSELRMSKVCEGCPLGKKN